MNHRSSDQPASTPARWQQLDNSKLLRFLLLFACGWASVQLIAYFYGVLAIFTTAAIAAVLLNYPVRALSRYMPRGLAIVLTLLATSGILLTFVSLLGLEMITQGQGLANHISTTLSSKEMLPFKDILNKVNLEQVLKTLQTGLVSGLGIAQGIFSSVFLSIFTVAIAVYMLIDGRQVWSTCLRLVPVDIRDRFDATFQRSFLGFLRGQFLLIIFLSTVSFLLFSLLGVQYSLILALIVGILDAIPGIGATLGVFTVVMLVLGSQGFGIALKVLIASLVLQQIQDNLVQPKVMGNVLKINPVFLFFALFVGERVAGLLGVFLSIPLSGMIAAWLQADTIAAKSADSLPDPATNPTEESSSQ
jgi:predicted PurR-regulated permease PerM